MSVVTYVTRLLPVAFGVHTVLNVVVMFLLSITYLKMPVIQSIISVIISYSLVLIIESSCSFVQICIIGPDEFFRCFSDGLESLHYRPAIFDNIRSNYHTELLHD